MNVRALVTAVLALSVAGCGSSRLSSVRRAYASQFNCPVSDVSAWRSGSSYQAQGCGYSAVCSGPHGPCREPMEAVLRRAQDTFSYETQCAPQSVQVYMGNEGVVAQGCGRYAVCPGSAATCFTRTPPSRQELASSQYNACVAATREDGDRRRPRYGSTEYYVASTVTATVLENKGMNNCRSNYDAQMWQCQNPQPQ
jgi:hypothetical protein